MKVFNVKTQNGNLKEITMDKIIKCKHKGYSVVILGVSKVIDKSYKNGR